MIADAVIEDKFRGGGWKRWVQTRVIEDKLLRNSGKVRGLSVYFCLAIEGNRATEGREKATMAL